MRLLYLLPEYVNNAGGGIITFYRHLLPLLAAQGHEIRVIVGSGVSASSDPSMVVLDGVRVEALDETRLPAYYERFARYASMPSLRRFLAGAWAMREQAAHGEGYDAVEATDWGLLFLPWVVEAGPPSIVQLHGSSGQIDMHDPVPGEEAQSGLLRLLERTAIPRATGVQGYGRSNVQFWKSQLARPVTRILPAWKPLEPLAPGATRSQRGLVVGRVQKWKGPRVLCEALRLLGPRAPAIDWLGRDMPYGPRGRTMAQHLQENWPDVWGLNLVHVGQASAAEALQRQARAAFVIVPSEWDTFNFTCVEAMAAGTPVICSTGAGASELIEDGVNGFTFEKQDAQSLAQALERLLSLSEPARAQLAQAGQATVLRALDPETNARLRMDAYRNAIAAPVVAPLPADDWLRLAATPRDDEAESLDFLNLVPLRGLVGHSARRLMRKLGL
jgi:glycosyltransferase involved in cell wall biosynthesis